MHEIDRSARNYIGYDKTNMHRSESFQAVPARSSSTSTLYEFTALGDEKLVLQTGLSSSDSRERSYAVHVRR